VTVGVLAERIDIDLAGDPDSLHVTLDGQDVTERIRDEDVTDMSSIISTIPAVRRAMVRRQRELGRRGAVMSGRDIGTVVFAAAVFYFFLTATPAARAERRLAEERQLNPAATFAETLADMTERDARDSTRADSPLVAAVDAVVLDTTGVPVDEVLRQMVSIVQQKTGN